MLSVGGCYESVADPAVGGGALVTSGLCVAGAGLCVAGDVATVAAEFGSFVCTAAPPHPTKQRAAPTPTQRFETIIPHSVENVLLARDAGTSRREDHPGKLGRQDVAIRRRISGKRGAPVCRHTALRSSPRLAKAITTICMAHVVIR